MSSSPAPMRGSRGSFLRDPVRLFLVTVPAGAAGLIVLLDSAAAGSVAAPVAFMLVNWAAVLVGLALLVGLLSVVASHFVRVLNRRADWGYSVILLLSMVAVILVGIVGIPGLTVLMPPNLAEEPIRRFFHAVYEPLTSSLLALLTFFSLSTIIRAVRQRRPEVLVIVGVALVVLIVQVPLVAMQPLVADVLRWFSQYVALAGARGLLIGVAIGTLVASMRVLLGFDQPYMDD